MRLGNRNPKVGLIATGIAFIVSGIDCYENDLIIIAVTSIVVGALNVFFVFFVKKHPFFIKVFLLGINAAFAFLSSYEYYVAGRDKIQYGWAAVGLISVFFLIRNFIINSRRTHQS